MSGEALFLVYVLGMCRGLAVAQDTASLPVDSGTAGERGEKSDVTTEVRGMWLSSEAFAHDPSSAVPTLAQISEARPGATEEFGERNMRTVEEEKTPLAVTSSPAEENLQTTTTVQETHATVDSSMISTVQSSDIGRQSGRIEDASDDVPVEEATDTGTQNATTGSGAVIEDSADNPATKTNVSTIKVEVTETKPDLGTEGTSGCTGAGENCNDEGEDDWMTSAGNVSMPCAKSGGEAQSAQDPCSPGHSVHSTPSSCRPGARQTRLHILGLFAMEGEYTGGRASLEAATLALKQLSLHPSLLPGVCLVLHPHNTKCDSGRGIEIFYDGVFSSHVTKPFLVFGASCSHVTEIVGRASTIRHLPQVSYSAMSASLSNKTVFPYFSRLSSPESKINTARLRLLQHFRWKRIAIIYQLHDLFYSMVENLDHSLREVFTVTKEPFSDDNSIPKAVRRLKEADLRIIVGAFYESKARQVLCAAYHQNLTYPRVVWVLSGLFDRGWWRGNHSDLNCTEDQMDRAVQGYLVMDRASLNRSYDRPTDSGLTPTQFDRKYEAQTANCSFPYRHRAPLAFDAIWAIAKGLNRTMRNIRAICNRTLDSLAEGDCCTASLISRDLRSVSFMGVMGHPVSFDSQGDPALRIDIRRYLGNNTYLDVGRVTPDNDSSTDVWFELEGPMPLDQRARRQTVQSVDRTAHLAISGLASVGVLLALCFLVFNVACRQHRIIKMSSPNFNNIILVGCILAYINVFIVSSDGKNACFVFFMRTAALLLGFSLAFGSLFAKTWRVYSIHKASQQLHNQALRDKNLALLVGAVVLVNSLLLLAWRFVPPVLPQTVQLSQVEDEERDVVEVLVMVTVSSQWQFYFVGAILALQGLLCIIGAFLAWETRDVQIRWLNDSRQIALCIYNVVVVGVVGVVVGVATEKQVTLGYCLTGVLLILATTATQCLIFVPKVISYLYRCGEQTKLVGLPHWHAQSSSLSLSAGSSNSSNSSSSSSSNSSNSSSSSSSNSSSNSSNSRMSSAFTVQASAKSSPGGQRDSASTLTPTVDTVIFY